MKILKRQYNSIDDVAGNDTKEAIEVKEIENDDNNNNINTNTVYSNIPTPLSLNN